MISALCGAVTCTRLFSQKPTCQVPLKFLCLSFMCPLYWFHKSHPHPAHSFTVSQGFFRDPVIHWQLKYQLSFPLPFICTHDDGWKRIDLHSILSPAWSLTADHTPFNFTEIQWAQKLTLSILCFLFRVQLPRQKSAFRISLLPVIAIK